MSGTEIAYAATRSAMKVGEYRGEVRYAPTQCPVLTERVATGLRECYATSGTDIALCACYAMSGTERAYAATARPVRALCTATGERGVRYAMSGTGIAYGVQYWHSRMTMLALRDVRYGTAYGCARATQCLVLTRRTRSGLHPRYAMSGTDAAHGASCSIGSSLGFISLGTGADEGRTTLPKS
eukprot:1415950-Rhodomonas_salina.2